MHSQEEFNMANVASGTSITADTTGAPANLVTNLIRTGISRGFLLPPSPNK